jgi:hypothetical protein
MSATNIANKACIAMTQYFRGVRKFSVWQHKPHHEDHSAAEPQPKSKLNFHREGREEREVRN